MDAASFKSTIYGNGLGTITFVFLVVVIPLYDTTFSLRSHLGLVNLYLILIVLILRLYLSINISSIKSCADFKYSKNHFDITSSLIFIVTPSAIIFLIAVAFDFVSMGTKITDISIGTAVQYFLVIVLLVLVILLSDKNYNDLTHKLESMLLEKYSETFPHIYVKADARELQGKVQDIFNDNFIVFGYNGLKIPVEWDKITSIKLSERADNEAETG